MNDADKYNAWQELLRLIAEYDWAVEGAPAPANAPARATAVTVRNALVNASKEILL